MRNSTRVFIVCGLGLLWLPATFAATFNVNTVNDLTDFDPGDGVCEATNGGGDCSVRAAIMESNALAGPDTIEIPAGTYLLTIDGTDNVAAVGDLDIPDTTLTINGAGRDVTILDANGIDRFFQVARSDVDMQDLTIRGGVTDADANSGGAILLNGVDGSPASLVLRRVNLLDNGAKLGGAIRATPETTALIEDSFFQGNVTLDVGVGNRTGGAIYCQSCEMTLNRCTFTGNGDELSGKIIQVDGNGQLNILNSTISGNPFGGGIRLSNANALIKFSTLINNGSQNLSFFTFDGSHVFEVTATVLQNATHDNCQSGDLPASLGYNVVGDLSCAFTETGDVEDVDALMEPLGDNGGLTLTHEPGPGSPAIDRVPPASCTDLVGAPLVIDQRDMVRPFGPNCDSGSVEADVPPLIRDGFEDP